MKTSVFQTSKKKEDPMPHEFVFRVHRGRSVSILLTGYGEKCLVEVHESDVSRWNQDRRMG